ncbi:MAG: hypothetical protein KZQ86_01680, partial [Candidatus Thiodiazotropha sp. (ex Lucinoma kastoroae)]|nr:hypothetical protein [Candidatus Thiodiazotropha sp. (ex Lucinoma kastoroae)]
GIDGLYSVSERGGMTFRMTVNAGFVNRLRRTDGIEINRLIANRAVTIQVINVFPDNSNEASASEAKEILNAVAPEPR